MPTCEAIKSTGDVCGKGIRTDGNRCTTHAKSLQTNGPHLTARKELNYKHRAAIRVLLDEASTLILNEPDLRLRQRIEEDFEHRIHLLKLQQSREMTLLVNRQEDQVRELGFNPDAEAEQRREEQRRARMENARRLWQLRFDEAREALHGDGGGAHGNNNDRELERFANDNQNVHTTVAVQQTKDIIQKILNIPVPEGYRWNTEECSKTIGEIIKDCNLTPKGAWQMTARYCQDESIYDFEKGIYGKVLDGVWQYIIKSENKADLCAILKQEMEDNIGMCAQGNLTRICNILSGYMEGIGVQESPVEILGRKLPLLMEIENQEERLKEAYKLLSELGIPVDDWLSWVEPMVEDGIVNLQSTGAGQVIGFSVTSIKST